MPHDMNQEDADLVNAEFDADHERFRSYDPGSHFEGHSAALQEQHGRSSEQAAVEPEARREEIEEVEDPHRHVHRTGSQASVSTGSSSSSSASTISHSTGPGARPRPTHTSTLATISTQKERDIFAFLDRHPTAVQRIQEHRLQHVNTVGSTRLRSKGALPNFGGGKPYPPPLPEREEYVVEFDGHDDPRHPQNWPLKTKLVISAVLVFDSFAATFASSIFSPAATSVGQVFHVGREVTTLGTSLFVLGYAFGPIVWAPMSELYGRRLPIIIGAFAFGIFQIAVAVAKDLQTVMICRFFSGFMGACPLAVVAAVFADMYDNKVRGLAIAAFSGTVFWGPLTAPFIGGFITESYLGWRWTAYIPAFMGFASCALAFFLQKETYGPVILVEKAGELKRLTRNWGIHAKQEEVEVDVRELVVKNVSRPLRILFTEPIVLLVTIYMSFIYGLLYLSLTAYGIVFGQIYGMAPGVSGLPYFGMIVGVALGLVCIILLNGNYVRKLEANNNIPVPEWRLIMPMIGGIIFAIGLFWFGWTGYKASISYWAPTCAGIFLGFGIYTVFLQLLNYIVDSYLMFAASAIAANTFMRSLFGAVFPLFAYYMFEGIGINYGMTLLGCVAVLLVPAPFIFYFFGKRIRAKSKFAPAPDIQQDKRRDEESRGGAEGDDSNGSGTSGEKKDE